MSARSQTFLIRADEHQAMLWGRVLPATWNTLGAAQAGIQVESRRVYARALADAQALLEALPDLEPTSALKQAASDLGIPYGDEMGKFVAWAEARLT